MGTLKREAIKLQEHYESEEEAYARIKVAIDDYNFRRSNAETAASLRTPFIIEEGEL